MKTLSVLLLFLLVIGCSEDNYKAPLENYCNESMFIQELSENTPVTVKSVKEGEAFYNGIKIYYELDAETYLPNIFEQNNVKLVRLFPLNKINSNIGSQIMVKGTISGCLTGNHGLLTNDYIGFYLLNQ